MKLKTLLPLLIILFSFTACDNFLGSRLFGRTIEPEFSIKEENLKSRIASILPSEEINITTSKSLKKTEFNTLHIEILRPGTFPLNSYSFVGLAQNIHRIVITSISNINQFQKMEIVVRHSVEENGISFERSYKKEIDI
ncbi:hypothetical protein [Salinimicrobium xinjiangense]|uniref:hypothetical protein n=1 Tax=Salinimicrobium xinjiangense TaxID=438596 RepID=UPI00041E582D|nr:hypothetical protein [Salinimicrobium xinjiangense]